MSNSKSDSSLKLVRPVPSTTILTTSGTRRPTIGRRYVPSHIEIGKPAENDARGEISIPSGNRLLRERLSSPILIGKRPGARRLVGLLARSESNISTREIQLYGCIQHQMFE